MLDTAQHLLTSILTSTDLLGSSYLSMLDSSVIGSLHSKIVEAQNSIYTNWHLNLHMDLLAQQTKEFNQDVMGDIGKGWNNFVKSGQLAAMAIGLVVGYMFRSITNR
jgi:hypothetical protein